MRARAVPGLSARVLSAEGLSSDLWHDWETVAAWCEQHRLPAPLVEYRGHPRALRDHAAYWWAVKECPHPLLRQRPSRDAWERLGIPGMSRARMRARLEAHGIAGAGQGSDPL